MLTVTHMVVHRRLMRRAIRLRSFSVQKLKVFGWVVERYSFLENGWLGYNTHSCVQVLKLNGKEERMVLVKRSP